MIYKLKPVIKQYIWGSESWEVSTHPDGLSMIADGEFAGQTLRSVVGELPVLIKIIDARQPLSLQVHPNDEYAARTEGRDALGGLARGKNEMWYVLEAEPGAEIVLGFEKPVGRDELRGLLESGDIMSAVRRVPVKEGDCYCVPAGLLHSIGKGIKIIEVQQSSNITYRVYDYGRTDSAGKTRELHIDKALDVLDTALEAKRAQSSILTDWEYFQCELVDGAIITRAVAEDGTKFECSISTVDKASATVSVFS